MRTYNRQRREFVLLAMKLIENYQLSYWLEVCTIDELVKFGSYDQRGNRLVIGKIDFYFNEEYLQYNEVAIQKLRDLLRSEE